ncbi:MAG: hypothetical protein H0V01_07255 [Bacteroidetes bacterium]|nr:hypothetical protein [Bacteroidota bacterium]HET6244155.1 hypothetical protein [Bacteroidia bacterium]
MGKSAFIVLYFALAIFSKVPLLAQEIMVENESPEIIISKGLTFLSESQQKETIGFNYFKGEWGSYIKNTNYFPLFIKKGKSAYDSNCFTTTSVHNLLAEIYLNYPNFEIIPSMLEPAMENILLYQSNSTFNFWHNLPSVNPIQRSKHVENNQKYMQHRPNNFIFKSKFMNKCANICNDADDTALGFMALKLNNQVKNKLMLDSAFLVPDSIGHYFSRYRNLKRKKTHYYNFFFGKKKYLKGTFCTWFGEETPFTGISFLPFSSRQNQYIPYNSNEVDCIVNANILLALSHFGELNTPGVKEAVIMLKNNLLTSNCNYCGIYYPSEFTLHYIISQLIAQGMTDFEDYIPVMVDRLTKNQRDDGTWRTKIKGNELQVTLYALIALLNIDQVEKHNTLPFIEKSMNFILNQAIENENQVHWPGGVFFSGGTVIRDSFLWRSDAVTTALALTAILKYNELKTKREVKQ